MRALGQTLRSLLASVVVTDAGTSPGAGALLEYGLPGATGRTRRSGRQNWLLAHCSVVKEPRRSVPRRARVRDTVERNRHSRSSPPASQDGARGTPRRLPGRRPSRVIGRVRTDLEPPLRTCRAGGRRPRRPAYHGRVRHTVPRCDRLSRPGRSRLPRWLRLAVLGGGRSAADHRARGVTPDRRGGPTRGFRPPAAAR